MEAQGDAPQFDNVWVVELPHDGNLLVELPHISRGHTIQFELLACELLPRLVNVRVGVRVDVVDGRSSLCISFVAACSTSRTHLTLTLTLEPTCLCTATCTVP